MVPRRFGKSEGAEDGVPAFGFDRIRPGNYNLRQFESERIVKAIESEGITLFQKARAR